MLQVKDRLLELLFDKHEELEEKKKKAAMEEEEARSKNNIYHESHLNEAQAKSTIDNSIKVDSHCGKNHF